jgi:Tfp pilus assembly protein FimV
MKRWLWLFGISLVAGFAAFAITRHCVVHSFPDEMTWLREEFALTPAQASAIEQLNAAYEPVCADHCQRISQTRRNLRAIEAASNTPVAELAAAQAAWQTLCDECTTATRAHLEAVAAQMSPGQGKRYLELVGPKLTRREPGKPFGLR